ncbi:MAG: hypothetical protein NTZ94_16715 [Verrucomicrobia bacterium]|nr:hypothetical protein [Verrucomicrobiota bacterium]
MPPTFLLDGMTAPRSSSYDFIYGQAETFYPDRDERLATWLTPIKYSCNIIIERDQLGRSSDALRLLASNSAKPLDRLPEEQIIEYYTLMGSSAERYATSHLSRHNQCRHKPYNFDDQLKDRHYNGSDLYERLLTVLARETENLRVNADPSVIRWLVLDELMCLDLISKLKRDYALLLPCTSARSIRDHCIRRETPQFRVTIAIQKAPSLQAESIIEYLDVGSLDVIQTSYPLEVRRFSSNSFSNAQMAYRPLIESAMQWRCALLFTRFCFSLDHQSILTTELEKWKTILQLTRQLIDREISSGDHSANHLQRLAELVQAAFLLEPEEKRISDAGLRFLAEALDFEEKHVNELRIICKRRSAMTFLVEAIIRIMRGGLIQIQLEKKLIFLGQSPYPNTQPLISLQEKQEQSNRDKTRGRVVREMLRSLQAMYEEKGILGFDEVVFIEFDLQSNLSSFLERDGGFISLAVLKPSVAIEDEPEPYVGMLAVTPDMPNEKNKPTKGYREVRQLCYLWVDPLFRESGAGRLLLFNTLDALKKQKQVKLVYFALIPELSATKKLLLSLGFQLTTEEDLGAKIEKIVRSKDGTTASRSLLKPRFDNSRLIFYLLLDSWYPTNSDGLARQRGSHVSGVGFSDYKTEI